MDSACLKELATEISSDSDHSTKVAPTTLKQVFYRSQIIISQNWQLENVAKKGILWVLKS